MRRALLRSSAVLLPLLLGVFLGCGSADNDPGEGGAGGGDGGGSFTGPGTNETDPTNSDPAPGTRFGGHGTQQPEGGETATDAGLQTCTSGAAPVTFYMSADDSNSMASPVLAREALRAGRAPDPARIRTYEFLNYYNAHYDLPKPGELGVHVEMQDPTLSPTVPESRYRLQIGVQAPEAERAPLVVTFVVDASGSLIGPGIERERAALLAISNQLRSGDVVNVVTWAGEDNVLLEGYHATGTETDDDKLAAVVTALAPGGGSDLHAGLQKGYELARAHFDPAGLNRVVLLSDGGANLGVVDRNEIAGAAEDAEQQRIYLVGIGVGPDQGYSDTLMDLVTDAGRGAYVYLDDPAEAASVFATRFDEVMNIAAHDVQIKVDLPSYLEIADFYGEKYSSDHEVVKPQTLAPGDSMILNQSVYVADGATACGDDVVTVEVTWQTALAHEERSTGLKTFTLFELLKPPSPQAIKASAVIAYAKALEDGGKPALEAAAQLAIDSAKAANSPDLVEIAELIALHPAMKQ